MFNIYIDTINYEISIRDKKNKLLKKYSNLSVKNSSKLLTSIKLLITSLNKIFKMNNRYYDAVYMFYITDEELINYIKTTNSIRKHIKKEWHKEMDNKTLSELGNLLKIFDKISSKDIDYWNMESDERYLLRLEREKLNNQQSELDTQIQDILHEIQMLEDDDITQSKALSYILKIRDIRKRRNKIKINIKLLEKKERNLKYEKGK